MYNTKKNCKEIQMESENNSTIEPVKIYVDPLGYMPSTIDRIVDERKEEFERVTNPKDAKIAYIDSEEWRDVDLNTPFGEYYEQIGEFPVGTVGPSSPGMTWIDTKLLSMNKYSRVNKKKNKL